MFKTMCLLVVVVAELLLGKVFSWDIAVTTDNHIELYSNNIKVHSKDVQLSDVSALAYDAVHNMLLFAGTQNDSSYIFSYDIVSNNLNRRRSNDKILNGNIRGLAYDPIKEMLFWANPNEKSLYSISIKHGLRRKKNDLQGKRIIEMDDRFPTAIAIDSCRRYIYWANIFEPSIERSHFDGQKRQTIIKTHIHMPMGLAIDQMGKKIYWVDRKEGIYYSIESADLHGEHRTILINGTYQEPDALTISTDAIYWVDTVKNAIWKLPKNPSEGTKPTKYIEFSNKSPFSIAIATNYPTAQQISSLNHCKRLKKVVVKNSTVTLQNSTVTIQNSSNDESDFCVHGKKVSGIQKCICAVGYTGDRCSVTVCYNYCLYGNCSVSDEGLPKCRCTEGFTGTRCNINICQGYCLNQGTCLLDEQNEPLCQCLAGYEGTRCETLSIVGTTSIASRAVFPDESEVTVCECNSNLTSFELLPTSSELSDDNEYEYDMTIILSTPRVVSLKRPSVTIRPTSFAAASTFLIILFVVFSATVLSFYFRSLRR